MTDMIHGMEPAERAGFRTIHHILHWKG